MGVIYQATNVINGKIYIGQTINKFEDRIKSHLSEAKKNSQYYFHRAIRKYGANNFDWKILEICDDSFLNEREIYYIEKFHSYSWDGSGYNMTRGGENNFGSKGDSHWLNRKSEKEKKKWITEHRIGNKNPNYGNGKATAGNNHFYNKMSKKDKRDFIKATIAGDNNYQKKMTKQQLIEKSWINKLSKEERRELSQKFSGDNNPFRRAYLKDKEKYKQIAKETGLKLRKCYVMRDKEGNLSRFIGINQYTYNHKLCPKKIRESIKTNIPYLGIQYLEFDEKLHNEIKIVE